MSKKRRYFFPGEKVKILKEHLLEHQTVSDVCQKHEIKPLLFYSWQKQFFENGYLAFDHDRKNGTTQHAKRILQLEQKLKQKNEVVSELLEEHIALKKNLGVA